MFQGLDGRDAVGRFDGGEITSDAGGVLCVKWSNGLGFWIGSANASPTIRIRIASSIPSRR